MLNTRPNISAVVKYCSRFQHNTALAHWNGLKRILRYLQCTANTEKEIVILVGNRVLVISLNYLVRQKTVALSSTEAEHIALATAATVLLWLKYLLDELEINIGRVTIYEDMHSSFGTTRRS